MILLTGGSGVLGQALTRELTALGAPFRVVSNRDVNLTDSHATDRLLESLKPDLVYHLAGRVHGLGGNSRYPADMFTENIRINANVIDAARKTGCRKFVGVSTVAIYSSDAPMPVGIDQIWDGPPHYSEAPYGHAKRAMLVQLEACAKQYGMAFAYPIMTNIYGPHDRFDAINGHVVPSLVTKFHKAATEGAPVTVWGRGVAERDFIAASDAARALILIAERHEGPINVATGTVVKIRDVVDILSEHSGVSNVQWDGEKPDGQLLRRYDVQPLRDLGFECQTSLTDGLRATYDWYAGAYPDVRR